MRVRWRCHRRPVYWEANTRNRKAKATPIGSSSVTRNRSTTGGMSSFATALNDHTAINTSREINERMPRLGSCEVRRDGASPPSASPETVKNAASPASTAVTETMQSIHHI